MRQSILSLFALLFSLVGYSQQVDFANYVPIASLGEMPKDFTMRTSDKVISDVNDQVYSQIRNNEYYKTRKAKLDFIEKSNYIVDNLLQSGNVLYGDPVTNYVNKIADKLLEDKPELRNELRFYCLKSNVTNAFATNQGIIFITLGLIAELENEAQLAFILGHEIHHYEANHIINSVLNTDKVLSRSRRRQTTSQDDNIRVLSNYSKELELEADSAGFHYLINAGYSLQEAYNSFEILQFSRLPYDEVKFDFSEFETTNFNIPQKLKLDTLIEINFEVNEDDSESSHPNLNKRRTRVEYFLSKVTNRNLENKYLISKADFLKCQSICRFESVRIDLKNLDFVSAFYTAKILLKKYPENNYLQLAKAKALYGIAKFKNHSEYYDCAEKYHAYEGEISAAYYFFENISKEALFSLAIKNITDEFQGNKSAYSEKLLRNLIEDFLVHVHHDFVFDDYFLTRKRIEADKKANQESAVEGNGLKNDVAKIETKKVASKYDKLVKLREEQRLKKAKNNIRAKESIVVNNSTYNFNQLVFDEYEYRDYLKSVFKDIQEDLLEKESLENEQVLSLDQTNKGGKRVDRNFKADNENRIGAEKILFIDPNYFYLSESKGLKLKESEKRKYGLNEKIHAIGDAASLELEILSPRIESKSSNTLNYLSICNDLMEEVEDLSKIDNEFNFIPSEAEFVDMVKDEIGCDYIAFTGVVDYKNRKELRRALGDIFWGSGDYYVIVGPLILLTSGFISGHQSYYYTYIIDVETSKLVVQKVYNIRKKANSGNINSFMYDLFTTLKSEKK